MESCAPFDAAQGYAMALTRYVDCQAALLGEGGYLALSAGNSPIIIALGSLLTIMIAFQGYRLLLGDNVQIRDGIVLAAKVGLVLAFMTQWSAYRAVVYNLAIEAPREILALLPGAGGGSGRSFPARLQNSYQSIAEITRPSSSVMTAAPSPAVQTSGATDAGAQSIATPPTLPFALVGNPLLTAAGVLLLVSGLAVLISVRLLAGLLLALGPLFFACLLFDTTRGLFEGWVRALVGTAIASIMTGVLLGFEMSILEPQIASLLQAMMVGTLPALAPGEILATVLIFTLALGIGLFMALRIGSGFRFLERSITLIQMLPGRGQNESAMPQADPLQKGSVHQSEIERSRATAISSAIRSTERWEANPALAGSSPGNTRRMAVLDTSQGEARSIPLGQSYRRAGKQRNSRSISHRNGRI